MNIKFTPVAQWQLELVRGTPAISTGFILGSRMGKFMIIESLFPVFFDPTTIDPLYAGMMAHAGDKLLGVFFNFSQPFLSDWFIEDIVLHIQETKFLVYHYDAEEHYVLFPV